MPGTEAGRFARAVERFETAHREDPRSISIEGETMPWSVHYHRRVREWVDRFAPDASVALRLAAHAQHIRRWTIPRETYEDGRSGYKRWRSELARFHAAQAAEILRAEGYDEELIARVGALLTKQRLKSDPEMQVLEDAVCLVFLENEFAAFSEKHDAEKVADIVKKTWAKMSPAGHNEALELVRELPERLRALIAQAVS